MLTSLTAGTQVQANTYTTSLQTNSAIATLTGGGFVVVWHSNGQDGNGYGVYGQRFDATGAKVGSEFQIDTTGAVSQLNPKPVALNDGGFLVVWGEDNATTDVVSARRYDANGTALGSEFVVSTASVLTAVGTQPYSLTILNDGSLVAAYGTSGTNAPAKAQRFNANGAKIGTEFSLNTTTRAINQAPALSALETGGFVAVWQGGTGAANSLEIYAQLFDSSGVKVGAEFRVNTTTTGEQTRADVVTLANGNFVVVWQSAPASGGTGQDGHLGGTYAQMYDATGTKIGTEFQLNSYTLGNQLAPKVAALADGGFAVAWQSAPDTLVSPQDGAGSGVFVQRYDASGQRVGGELLAAQTTAGDQAVPAIGALSNGGFVVSWNTPDANSTGVATRVFGPAATGPVIGALSSTITLNNEISARSLFYQDNSGTHDGLQQINILEFIDTNDNAGSGHFVLNGVQIAANQVISITSQELDSLKFVGGAVSSVDSFQVRASDGVFWSGWGNGSVTTVAPNGTLTPGAETTINTYQTSIQLWPKIAVLSGGGYAVAWTSDGQDGSGYGVYGRVFDADGRHLEASSSLTQRVPLHRRFRRRSP